MPGKRKQTRVGPSGGGEGKGDGVSGHKVLTPQNSQTSGTTITRGKRVPLPSSLGIEGYYALGRQQTTKIISGLESVSLTPSTPDEEVLAFHAPALQLVDEVNLISPSLSIKKVCRPTSLESEVNSHYLGNEQAEEESLPVELEPVQDDEGDDGVHRNTNKSNKKLLPKTTSKKSDLRDEHKVLRKRRLSQLVDSPRQDEQEPVVMKKARVSLPTEDGDETSKVPLSGEKPTKVKEAPAAPVPKVIKRRNRKPPILPIVRPVRIRKTVLPALPVVVTEKKNGKKKGRPSAAEVQARKNPPITNPGAKGRKGKVSGAATAPAQTVSTEYTVLNPTVIDFVEYGKGLVTCLPRTPDTKEQIVADGIKHFRDEQTATLKSGTSKQSKRDLKDYTSYEVKGKRTTVDGITQHQVVWKDGNEKSDGEGDEVNEDDDAIYFENHEFLEYFFDKMPVEGASIAEKNAESDVETDV